MVRVQGWDAESDVGAEADSAGRRRAAEDVRRGRAGDGHGAEPGTGHLQQDHRGDGARGGPGGDWSGMIVLGVWRVRSMSPSIPGLFLRRTTSSGPRRCSRRRAGQLCLRPFPGSTRFVRLLPCILPM